MTDTTPTETSEAGRRCGFVAVIGAPTSQDAPIDIRLAGGHRVRVRAGCDRGLLADVLALLRDTRVGGRPC